MSEYACPYCGRDLPAALVEDFDAFRLMRGDEKSRLECPTCSRETIVYARIGVAAGGRCPECNCRLGVDNLIDGSFHLADRDHITDLPAKCPECAAEVEIDADVGLDIRLDPARTIVVNGERVPDMDYDMAAVMAHFARRPETVRLTASEVRCQHCRRPGDASLATAADYIAAGWRVAPEYPGYRLTCPACYGGERHELAA